MSRRGQGAIPVVWEWSRDPPECQGVVGRPCRMSQTGGEAPTYVQEWPEGTLLDVRQLSGCPLDVLEALQVVREWSGDPPKCLGLVGVPHGCL